MSVWTDHKAAYERVAAAREEQFNADAALEDARRAVIAHVTKILANEEGFDNRQISAMDGDPLLDFVKAAESRYADTLGLYKPRKPLQIEIMNPRSLDTGKPQGVGEAPFDTGSVL